MKRFAIGFVALVTLVTTACSTSSDSDSATSDADRKAIEADAAANRCWLSNGPDGKLADRYIVLITIQEPLAPCSDTIAVPARAGLVLFKTPEGGKGAVTVTNASSPGCKLLRISPGEPFPVNDDDFAINPNEQDQACSFDWSFAPAS